VTDGRRSAPLPIRQLRYFSLVTELTVTELTTGMQNTRILALLNLILSLRLFLATRPDHN